MAASAFKVGVADMFADRGVTGITAYAVEVAVPATQADITNDKIAAVVIAGGGAAVPGLVTVTMNQNGATGGISALTGATNDLAYAPSINNAALADGVSGTISWNCKPAAALAASGELNAIAAPTTIISKYLPASCR
ncbi:MAG: pilin [Cocleimonas sp.]|nr:pilin [Cocleimonas sp.]